MLLIKKIHSILTMSCLILLPYSLSAQSKVPDASWESVDHFKYGNSGTSETLRNVKLDANLVAVGEYITVINLDTGNEIATFKVKSIRYGRQVKMCWIGDSEGIIFESYITVKRCKRQRT